MPRQPFDAARMAMWLLVVLICTPIAGWLLIVLRCVISFRSECIDADRLATFRDWLGEALAVLVAIIMAGRQPPAPPTPPAPPHSDE